MKTQKSFIKSGFCLLAVFIGQGLCATARPVADQPNFLIVMADDLGYGDLGIHGGYAPTPHLDRLFRSGLVMENFMVTPLCSPTRASLLTGCNPLRLNQGPFVDGNLSPQVTTFGSAFQRQGYATGIFGKWHNSRAPIFNASAPDVNDFGFDEWVGGYGGGFDFFTKIWPGNNSTPCWYHNRTHVTNDMDYATDVLTDHAIRFMEDNRSGRFVCYLPHLAVHEPYHAKMEDIKRVPKALIDAAGGLRSWEEYYKLHNDLCFGGRLGKGYVQWTGDHSMESIAGKLSDADMKVVYAAMLINLDDNVGRLLAYLKKSGLEKNTVVWFFSDNGGTVFNWIRNQPLRGRKAMIWEGGIHSRAVVRWPAAGWDQYRTFDGLLGSQDIYPTCMEMAGLSVPHAADIDGKPCFEAMRTGTSTPVEAVYYLWEGTDVIRTEQWKLVRFADRAELYSMAEDLCETIDVAAQHPELVRSLTEKLDDWMTKNGVTAGHLPHVAVQPVAKVAHPAPLEIEFTQTKPGRTRGDRVCILRMKPFSLETGDRLEYDILFDEASKIGGGHLTLRRSSGRPLFLNQSVDQFGRLFSTDYSYGDACGQWAHRVIGVGHGCPESVSSLSFMLTGKKPGKYHFYLDNVMIRRRDGSTQTLWRWGMPVSGISAPDGVEDLQVAVAADAEPVSPAFRVPVAPARVTRADVRPVRVNSAAWKGASNDMFKGAVVTGSTSIHQRSDIADLFTGPECVKKNHVVFNGSGTVSSVDFQLPGRVDPDRVEVILSSDFVAEGPDARAANRIRFFAADTAGAVKRNLIAEVEIDPEYQDTYGSSGLVVSMDVSLRGVQYFRIEITGAKGGTANGPRVVEIDGLAGVEK